MGGQQANMDQLVTFYLVINDRLEFDDARIQAWSDQKDLAKFYMAFHRCKHFTLRKITDTLYNMNRLLDECYHGEITLYNAVTKDRSKKRSSAYKYVRVPMTNNEIAIIKAENSGLAGTAVNYTILNDLYPYMSKKRKRLANDMMLTDAIKATIHNQPSQRIMGVKIDELYMLYRIFPETFGP